MQAKLESLKTALRGCGRTLVAYSGGVDSVLLAKLAHDALGDDMLAVIADSPSLPRRELAEALSIAARFRFPVRVIRTDELDDEEYASNPPNRCYFCKSELFSRLTDLAIREQWQTIAYGENVSDLGDHRPGAEAAAEYQVRAPLTEAGLTKDEIRAASAELGLPTADKPQMACLSSRVAPGVRVTRETLARIEAAENVLRDAGFREVRVRHHEVQETAGPGHGLLARIEVGVGELGRMSDGALRDRIAAALKELGYRHVTLDLLGYRRGSTNGMSATPKRPVAVAVATNPNGSEIE